MDIDIVNNFDMISDLTMTSVSMDQSTANISNIL